MRFFTGSYQALRRYLTPFNSIALGLGLLLAVSAMIQDGPKPPEPAKITQSAVISKTSSPTLEITQVHSLSKPTALPAIPPTPNEQTPTALGVTASELHSVQVSLWYPWTGAMGVAFQTILDEFNRINQWGISVHASAYADFGSQDEAVEAGLSSGSIPNVLVDYGYQAQHWDESGVLVNLTPYVDDRVWGLIGIEQADFLPNFWAEDLVKNTNESQLIRLAIPYYRSAYLLFYNHSWAKELGFLNPPGTPGEFKAQACAAAQDYSQQDGHTDLGRGGWLVTPQPGAWVGWIYAFGGNITDSTTSGYSFNTPATQQAFEYLKGLQVSGCAWSEAGVDEPAEFASREALFVVGSLFDLPAQRDAFSRAHSSDEWMVIPFPSNRQPVVDTYGPSLMVTRSTPAEQLASWLVVKWLVYPPNLTKWVVQNETYPTRQSVLSYLSQAAAGSTQWEQALMLVKDARGEPSNPSWSVMRWALDDAVSELMDSQFAADQIPQLLQDLDSVALEISTQVR